MCLLATDLDGTLVFHRIVGQVDAEALVRWRVAGNLLVLATGRSVWLVQHAVEVTRASTFIGLDYDHAVCATGTIIIGVAGQVHHTRALETNQVRAVMQVIGDVIQAPVSVLASTLERDYVLDDPIGLSTDQRTPPDRLTAAPLPQVTGLGATSMPLHVPDVQTSATLASGLEETVGSVSYTRSTGFMDVTAAGESKGMGLDRLAELLADQGVEVSKVAAVGSSWNGISTFEQTDVPCAVAGAPGEAIEVAGGRTTPSVAALTDALLA